MNISAQKRNWCHARPFGLVEVFVRSVSIALLAICASSSGGSFAKPAGAHRNAKSVGSETIPFVLDAQRILLNVTFETPDVGSRQALVWFNMGMPAPILTKALYRELGIDRGHNLTIRIGALSLEAAPETVVDGDGGFANPDFAQRFAPHPVEAMLPAWLFQQTLVTLDYQHRALTLAKPEGRKPEGVAVPLSINTTTGLIAVDVVVDGKTYPMVIDAGSGYSWMRGRVLADRLDVHPDWRRAQGAVGLSNYNMLDLAFEKNGMVARVPELAIGPVTLEKVGLLGTGFGNFGDSLVGDLFWDTWQRSAPSPVIGWLGGNALKPFELTIDFPNRMSYWRRQAKADAHDLDQVPITLVRHSGGYFIGGCVRNTGPSSPESASVEGCEIGDELVAVDGLSARGASIEQVLSALHGVPGERRRLVIEHHGKTMDIEARITAFD